jgi:voltage-gated potassium channel
MFVRFLRHFFHILWLLGSVYLALFALIGAGAATIAAVEQMPFDKALYFSLITGLTIGYGDVVPATSIGRIAAVLLGVIGTVFNGLVVAGAVHAVQQSWTDTNTDRKSLDGKARRFRGRQPRP